jgi:hypothetical protein
MQYAENYGRIKSATRYPETLSIQQIMEKALDRHRLLQSN